MAAGIPATQAIQRDHFRRSRPRARKRDQGKGLQKPLQAQILEQLDAGRMGEWLLRASPGDDEERQHTPNGERGCEEPAGLQGQDIDGKNIFDRTEYLARQREKPGGIGRARIFFENGKECGTGMSSIQRHLWTR
ncbi:MAG TPA: hypothetical protein VFV38_05045 [Ktedonobacteraceae bacterium]|nr:hypothetical protein [Ktedonobacteraceae bacterium]